MKKLDATDAVGVNLFIFRNFKSVDLPCPLEPRNMSLIEGGE